MKADFHILRLLGKCRGLASARKVRRVEAQSCHA